MWGGGYPAERLARARGEDENALLQLSQTNTLLAKLGGP